MTEKKKKLVMVFGTFDYLHAGHEHYLKKAKELGNETIAIIARDKTVKNIKGRPSDHSEKERLENLENTNWVDKVVLGDLKDKTKVIKNYRPDIIALGYDQFNFTYSLKKLIIEEKMDTEIIRIDSYRPDLYKSSIIKAQNEQEQEE